MLLLDKFQGADFKHDRTFLKLDKFKGADFKYDNVVFKLQHKNTQIGYFYSQIFTFLLFSEVLQLEKFEDVDFK